MPFVVGASVSSSLPRTERAAWRSGVHRGAARIAAVQVEEWAPDLRFAASGGARSGGRALFPLVIREAVDRPRDRGAFAAYGAEDRKSVVVGKRVSVRVDLGGDP